ncbi:hypothetical protein WCNC_03377 [Weissella ceti NC36]|nr:hypothetical protein WCNC_03377 [Weissella ceti NC36]
MKDTFIKHYWYYASLIGSTLLLALYFSPIQSQWIVIVLMFPTWAVWLYYIERQRYNQINQLQTRLNTLSKRELNHLAVLMQLPVVTLTDLKNTRLRHTQIKHLQQLLHMED